MDERGERDVLPCVGEVGAPSDEKEAPAGFAPRGEAGGSPAARAAAPASLKGDDLTHVNEQGRARMVDVSDKPATDRRARAAGFVRMAPSTVELVRTGGAKKGDVLAVAQVAGIMAAKRCWETVPMCHPVSLTGVDVRFSLRPDGVAVEAACRCHGETGVEMEALSAVSAAALTVYDMLKAHQRDMVVEEVRLLEKSGGASGDFAAAAPARSATVEAVCVSEGRGTRKHPVDVVELVVGTGVAGDAHAGNWHRQVSLLPAEAVDELRDRLPGLAPGDFAENILTRGLDLKGLPVGTVLLAGSAELVVTQIGKECHSACEIRRLTGKCAMPTEGIFCVVTRGGAVRAGDKVEVVAR